MYHMLVFLSQLYILCQQWASGRGLVAITPVILRVCLRKFPRQVGKSNDSQKTMQEPQLVEFHPGILVEKKDVPCTSGPLLSEKQGCWQDRAFQAKKMQPVKVTLSQYNWIRCMIIMIVHQPCTQLSHLVTWIVYYGVFCFLLPHILI